MIREEWQRVRSLFESALEVDPANRQRFLEESCPDPATRREVESLLRSHEQAGTDFMSTPAIAGIVAEEEAQFRLQPGQMIGSYEILAEVAQGGMGAVYKAKRADGQYTQEVALKIVRTGFGSELIAVRLRNERQILASLDHPNIARILDGGTTADGLALLRDGIYRRLVHHRILRPAPPLRRSRACSSSARSAPPFNTRTSGW